MALGRIDCGIHSTGKDGVSYSPPDARIVGHANTKAGQGLGSGQLPTDEIVSPPQTMGEPLRSWVANGGEKRGGGEEEPQSKVIIKPGTLGEVVKVSEMALDPRCLNTSGGYRQMNVQRMIQKSKVGCIQVEGVAPGWSEEGKVLTSHSRNG